MAEKDDPGQDAKPAPKAKPANPSYQQRPRESADDRRSRQIAAAVTKQAELKREAAERRDRKNDPGEKPAG